MEKSGNKECWPAFHGIVSACREAVEISVRMVQMERLHKKWPGTVTFCANMGGQFIDNLNGTASQLQFIDELIQLNAAILLKEDSSYFISIHYKSSSQNWDSVSGDSVF